MMKGLQQELLKICPVCKGKEFENVLTCEDYTYSHEHFDIQKCVLCNFHFTNPRPDAKCIHNFYESPDYISHTGKTQSFLDSIYLRVRTLTLRWKYRLIARKKKRGKITRLWLWIRRISRLYGQARVGGFGDGTICYGER